MEPMDTLSDDIEEYLISRAKQCLCEGDPFMAKSWFLTASNLYPFSFKIQFERYVMAKEENNVAEASQFFVNLFSKHASNDANNVSIENEMKNIVDAVKNSKSTVNCGFYRQLFDSLSSELQQQLLVFVANRCEQTSDVCQLTLLILKKFPERINEHGLKLVDVLTSETCDSENVNYSPKYYRQLLVFDVLPVILSSHSNLEISEHQLYKLLEKTIALYVELNLSGSLPECETMEISKFGNENLDSRFYKIFNLIAQKLNWELNVFDENVKSVEIQFNKINLFYRGLSVLRLGDGANSPIDLSASNANRSFNYDERSMSQVLYSLVILFVICINKYSRETLSKLILVEKKSFSFNTDKVSKKRKLNYSWQTPDIQTNNEELKESLIGAVKCYELIVNDSTLKQEFFNRTQVFALDDCEAYEEFVLDSHLFRATYDELIPLLTNSSKHQLKPCLQLISSLLMLYEDSNVINKCISCASMILQLTEKSGEESNPTSTTISSLSSGHSGNRILTFLSYTPEDMLSYCVDALITCIKNREFPSLKPSDDGIGHLIVLSQYKWPKEVEVFDFCISLIKKSNHSTSHKKFSYPLFFDYIVNPDILEEFMALVNSEGYSLEFKDQSTTSGVTTKSAAKSMTTRGGNKNVKEETRNALMMQMKSSKMVLDKTTLINFILTEIKNYNLR